MLKQLLNPMWTQKISTRLKINISGMRSEQNVLMITPLEVYFNAGTAAQKKKKTTHIIQECMYHLKLKIFGNETLGRSSFIQLKRTIRNMKISPQLGVAAWSERFDAFQLYLPITLWDAGSKRGLYPTKYDEENCREILEYALSPVYLTKLHDDGLCLQSNP